VITLIRIAMLLMADAWRFVLLLLRSSWSLTAENLFLRRQLCDSCDALERSCGGRAVGSDAAATAPASLMAREREKLESRRPAIAITGKPSAPSYRS